MPLPPRVSIRFLQAAQSGSSFLAAMARKMAGVTFSSVLRMAPRSSVFARLRAPPPMFLIAMRAAHSCFLVHRGRAAPAKASVLLSPASRAGSRSSTGPSISCSRCCRTRSISEAPAFLPCDLTCMAMSMSPTGSPSPNELYPAGRRAVNNLIGSSTHSDMASPACAAESRVPATTSYQSPSASLPMPTRR